jgi:hypothetical protein
MLNRIIDFHLDKWKNDPFRKPLLLRGARQVGKTYAVRKLGRQFKSFVEVNFERLEKAADIFEKDLSPERLILSLSLLLKTPIPSLNYSRVHALDSRPLYAVASLAHGSQKEERSLNISQFNSKLRLIA